MSWYRKKAEKKQRKERMTIGGFSNTRLNHVEKKQYISAIKEGWILGCDYMRVQIPNIPISIASSILKNYFNYELEREYREVGWSAPGYCDRFTDRYRDNCTNAFLLVRRKGQASDGVHERMDSLYKLELNKDTLVDIWVELPGKFWQARTLIDTLNMVYYFSAKLNGHITRLDFKIDMYTDPIDTDLLDQAIAARNFCRVRKVTQYLITTNDSSKAPTVGYGFGSRESDTYTRYYDCKPVHKLDCRRWEVEFKGLKVQNLVRELLGLEQIKTERVRTYDGENIREVKANINHHIALSIAQFLFSCVDFVDRTKVLKNGNIDEKHRLPWWQDILELVGGRINTTVLSDKPNVERTIKHFQTISKSLSVVKDCLGVQKFYEWLKGTLEKAQSNYSALHKQMIEQYKYVQSCYDAVFEYDDDGCLV